MGLLDSVLGAMNNNGNSGNTGSGGSDGLGALIGMVASNPQIIQVVTALLSNEGGQGGLANLMAKFQQAGMGDVIQSWIGGGENMPVSANQMEQALGGETLSGVASQLGTSEHDAAGQLAQILPGLVNKMTPAGQAPAGGLGNNADLMGMLGGLLGKP